MHPTSLVKPGNPVAKIKFLAAAALSEVDGLVFGALRNRFANELGRRDYVTGEMWKNKPPFRLALNKAASNEIACHCKHSAGRGEMKFYKSGAALAQDLDGGPFPAYPSGKSWSKASDMTGSGKKFYHNVQDWFRKKFYHKDISGADFATLGVLQAARFAGTLG